MESKVSVIIPAYNEAENIKELLEVLMSSYPNYEIIVVDDASEDKTAELARRAGVKVISHPYNLGNGAAIKSGVRSATGNIFLFMDCDGQHNPSDISRLLEHIGNFDMVVGARTKASDVSKIRSLGNFLLRCLAEYLSGNKIDDLTSGFRAIRKERMLEFLHILPNGYSYPTTITIALLKSGYTVRYVHLETIKRRLKGKSGLRPFQDGLGFILIMLRIVMLFDPLKIFLPTSLLLLLMGLPLFIYDIFWLYRIEQSSLLLITVGIFIFFFGLLADQISHVRRELRQ